MSILFARMLGTIV